MSLRMRARCLPFAFQEERELIKKRQTLRKDVKGACCCALFLFFFVL
jgi:hypothetical protein